MLTPSAGPAPMVPLFWGLTTSKQWDLHLGKNSDLNRPSFKQEAEWQPGGTDTLLAAHASWGPEALSGCPACAAAQTTCCCSSDLVKAEVNCCAYESCSEWCQGLFFSLRAKCSRLTTSVRIPPGEGLPVDACSHPGIGLLAQHRLQHASGRSPSLIASVAGPGSIPRWCLFARDRCSWRASTCFVQRKPALSSSSSFAGVQGGEKTSCVWNWSEMWQSRLKATLNFIIFARYLQNFIENTCLQSLASLFIKKVQHLLLG